MPLVTAVANGLWLASAWRDAAAFRAGLGRVAEIQRQMVGDIEAFRERHPIRKWDEQQLELHEPVQRWERTSGSSGPEKRVPYTRTLQREFNRAINPWIVRLFAGEPRAFVGQAYWSVSPGGESDEEILGPIRRRLVRAVQAVPPSVRLTRENFREETLRYLTRCRSLSLISVWHPSFLALLTEGIDTEKTWPKLRVISCWADANAAAPAAALMKRFPHATLQPKGLLSTEGFVTIPYDGANVLAYRSHFFEFRSGDTVKLAHELRTGERYDVILTTGGGLRRYDTEDIVEVTGYREQAPILKFIGRAHHISDHFGEKLNEIFVRERMDLALREIPHTFAMLACDGDAYVLYIDSDAELASVAATLEHALRESYHYDLARRLGQLQALRVLRVRDGAATYLRVRGAYQTLGDIKIPALDREQGWTTRFAS
jgi:hypothetical protein